MSDLVKRVLTSIIGIFIIAFILYCGSWALKIALFIVSLEIIRELYNAFFKIGIKLHLPSLFIGNGLIFITSYFNLDFVYALIFFFFINALFEIFQNSYGLRESIYTVFSYLYGVFLFSLLGATNEILLVVGAFVIAFSTDTFAYIIGTLFGKHKLIPSVSPNKSVEGAIGGTICSTLCTILYLYAVDKFYMEIHITINVILVIVLASIAGQLGDLFASKIKRTTGVKDFSQILPGHGGILDRFDSLIFVSSFVYILFYLI